VTAIGIVRVTGNIAAEAAAEAMVSASFQSRLLRLIQAKMRDMR
jgi:hypothetical protein